MYWEGVYLEEGYCKEVIWYFLGGGESGGLCA